VDIVIRLAPSWIGLQILIDKEALAINITLNISKTVCMIVKPVNSRYAICDIFPAFNASGQILSCVTQFSLNVWGTLYAMTCVMMRI